MSRSRRSYRWSTGTLRWTAIILGSIVLLFGAAWFFYSIPFVIVSTKGVTSDTYLKAITDTRSTLVQAFGGLAVVVAAVVGALTLRHNMRAHQGTLAVTQRGQVTDRFTRAVAQLGSDKLDVRVGGVYALEQITRDAPDLHAPIIEILTAFVRTHARRPEDNDQSLWEWGHPTTDIEAIMGVLRRRDANLDRGAIDLNHTDLREVNLAGANLSSGDLSGTSLRAASLAHANLSNATLWYTDLGAADLDLANFQGADLRHVQMNEGTSMRGTDFSRAALIEVYLDGATLDHANLSEADVRGLQHEPPKPPAMIARPLGLGADETSDAGGS